MEQKRYRCIACYICTTKNRENKRCPLILETVFLFPIFLLLIPVLIHRSLLIIFFQPIFYSLFQLPCPVHTYLYLLSVLSLQPVLHGTLFAIRAVLSEIFTHKTDITVLFGSMRYDGWMKSCFAFPKNIFHRMSRKCRTFLQPPFNYNFRNWWPRNLLEFFHSCKWTCLRNCRMYTVCTVEGGGPA